MDSVASFKLLLSHTRLNWARGRWKNTITLIENRICRCLQNHFSLHGVASILSRVPTPWLYPTSPHWHTGRTHLRLINALNCPKLQTTLSYLIFNIFKLVIRSKMTTALVWIVLEAFVTKHEPPDGLLNRWFDEPSVYHCPSHIRWITHTSSL